MALRFQGVTQGYGAGTPIQNAINATRSYASDVHKFAAPPGTPGPAGPTVNQAPTQLSGGYTPPAGPAQIRPSTDPYASNPYGSPPAGTPPTLSAAPPVAQAQPQQQIAPVAPPIAAPVKPASIYIPQPHTGAIPPPPIVPATGPYGPVAGIPIRSY